MKTTFDPHRTVGELVIESPALAPILDDLRIDYACRGDLSLAEACARRGLDRETVLHALAQADRAAPDGGIDVARDSLDARIDHLAERHHAALRRELPRLRDAIDEVADAHARRDVALADLAAAFHDLEADLGLHFTREEESLFPALRALEADGAPPPPERALKEGLAAAVAARERIHAIVEELRRLTDHFRPPPDACPKRRAMLDGLRALEREIHLCLHEENNVIHARALAAMRRG